MQSCECKIGSLFTPTLIINYSCVSLQNCEFKGPEAMASLRSNSYHKLSSTPPLTPTLLTPALGSATSIDEGCCKRLNRRVSKHSCLQEHRLHVLDLTSLLVFGRNRITGGVMEGWQRPNWVRAVRACPTGTTSMTATVTTMKQRNLTMSRIITIAPPTCQDSDRLATSQGTQSHQFR